MLALSALDAALSVFDDVDVATLREVSGSLTDLFIALVDDRLGEEFQVVTPRDRARRGSQVSVAFAADGAYAVMQALIARGVVGDFRAPDILRFGLAPLYTRFVDVWDAVDRLRAVLASGEWRDPAFQVRAAVT